MALAVLILVALVASVDGRGEVAYRFSLADFSGPVEVNKPLLRVDRHHDEVYLVHANLIRVFNATGMEVYRFEAADELGLVVDLDVNERGDLLTLSRRRTSAGGAWEFFMTRCDYRGKPEQPLELSGLSESFADFDAHRLFLRDDRILLIDGLRLNVIEVTLDGAFVDGYDLAEVLGIDPDTRSTVQLEGINMDPAGNLLITVPVLFKAFVITPEREVRAFGRAGSNPGSFANISGVAGDDRGRIYVADRVRHVVMIFNKNFEFETEFGYYGSGKENLVSPSGLAIGPQGALYVSQMGGRGISVFTTN
jgi:hypothetical protein